MKIELETPSGLKITFEGDENSFKLFTGFLTELPGLADTLGASTAAQALPGPDRPDADEELEGAHADPLDPRHVASRLDAVEAKSDIDRITVMAQLAVDADRDGLDYELAARLFEDLGYPKPPRWAKTFSNAKARGYLRSAGERGVWRPTVQGENFARYGRKEAPPRRRAPAARRANQISLPAGGDDD